MKLLACAFVVVAMVGCGGKKKAGGGEGGGGGVLWKTAEQEVKLKWGSGDMVIKGKLPTGWEQKEQMGGVRWSMPEVKGMVNASLDIGPSYGPKKAKESAEDAGDPSYKPVDPPTETAGRWSRVQNEGYEMSPGVVRFLVNVYWEVGAVTMRCSGRVVAKKDVGAAWQQILDICRGVEVTVPAQ